MLASRTAVAVAAMVTLALAGCGSSTQGTTSTAAQVLHRPHPEPRKPLESNAYEAQLSGDVGVTGIDGAPPGAPNATGLVAITVDAPTNQICWRFSQLKNMSAPTAVRLYRRTAGAGSWRFGFALGNRYTSSGCAPVPKSLALLRALEEDPQQWYVTIHSSRFPGGAVRAQL